ncbi:uncharacterized protein LOC126474459 [Schistocerca serialis cubense]|uniref:uncharacterized protein LOC126474459 n=1 Tax=Schistocerca serialis cubense TaxID=2023355 RepID=UPI00214E6BF7|nr:uncharacterized protein LOC126474459 [Schistocerca serialis cubense]
MSLVQHHCSFGGGDSWNKPLPRRPLPWDKAAGCKLDAYKSQFRRRCGMDRCAVQAAVIRRAGFSVDDSIHQCRIFCKERGSSGCVIRRKGKQTFLWLLVCPDCKKKRRSRCSYVGQRAPPGKIAFRTSLLPLACGTFIARWRAGATSASSAGMDVRRCNENGRRVSWLFQPRLTHRAAVAVTTFLPLNSRWKNESTFDFTFIWEGSDGDFLKCSILS